MPSKLPLRSITMRGVPKWSVTNHCTADPLCTVPDRTTFVRLAPVL